MLVWWNILWKFSQVNGEWSYLCESYNSNKVNWSPLRLACEILSNQHKNSGIVGNPKPIDTMPVFPLLMSQQPFLYLLVKLKKHSISWFPILTIKLFTTGNVTASKQCQLEKVLLHSLIHFLEITAQYGVGNISLYSAQLVKINHWLYISLVSVCLS